MKTASLSCRAWLPIVVFVFSPALLDAQMTGTGTGATGGTGAMGGTGGSGGGNAPGVTGTSGLSTSFSGGTAGSSFSGGVSFSGGTAGGATGAGTGTAGRFGATGAASLAPTTLNPFRTSYINPLSPGLYTIGTSTSTVGTSYGATGGTAGTRMGAGGTASTTSTFGQPTYPISTTTTGGVGATGGFGNTGGLGAGGLRSAGGLGAGGLGAGGLGGLGSGGLGTGSTTGFTTIGTYRAPQYHTTLDESIPLVAHSAPVLHTRLQTIVASSATLQKMRGLDVAVDGGAVVLRGHVATDRERRLAEAMIRLTPGVREVRNELTVQAK